MLGASQPREIFFRGAIRKTIGTKPHGQLRLSMLNVLVRIFGSDLRVEPDSQSGLNMSKLRLTEVPLFVQFPKPAQQLTRRNLTLYVTIPEKPHDIGAGNQQYQ